MKLTRIKVERRNEQGELEAVIHSYAPGDGDLSFVAKDPRTTIAVSPSPTREECEAACRPGFEVYADGPYFRARRRLPLFSIQCTARKADGGVCGAIFHSHTQEQDWEQHVRTVHPDQTDLLLNDDTAEGLAS